MPVKTDLGSAPVCFFTVFFNPHILRKKPERSNNICAE